MNNIEISIRSIQHYMYCPHRWGLLEIERAWSENVFVTKANLMHERVHDPNQSYVSRGKKVFTSVSVYNDLEKYNLYGITDCLELTKSRNGIVILGEEEKYQICIVEYKPTHPKTGLYHEDDAMQVFAQKICVDYVFGGDCDCVIYYADIKKRISIPVKDNYQKYDETLQQLLMQMRYNLENGIIPPVEKKQNCSGCSMKDLCIPQLKPIKDIRTEIDRVERENL